jgi:hypothetical protein
MVLHRKDGPGLTLAICRQLAAALPLHYIIGNGNIHWAGAWSDAQIVAGRSAEEHRRYVYYAEKAQSEGFLNWLWRLLQRLFGR